MRVQSCKIELQLRRFCAGLSLNVIGIQYFKQGKFNELSSLNFVCLGYHYKWCHDKTTLGLFIVSVQFFGTR